MSSSRFFRASLALLAAPLAISSAQAVTVISSAPLGVIASDLTVGDNPVAFPLIEDDVLSATVTGNTGGAITFSSGNVGPLLTSSRKYYVEVVTGALEGERFDVNTTATIAAANSSATLDLSAASFSTKSTLAADALVGARCVIRPHVTLASLQSTFTPALTGNNNYNLADGVKVFTGGAFAFYYLRSDNVTWRSVGGTVDLRSTVIPPDVSILVALKSAGRRWTHLGGVRSNAFRKNFASGLQAFASGFPISLSPVGLSAFVDGAQSAGIRWTGNDDSNVADTLQIFSRPAFTTYFLRADGTSWWQTGSSTDVATTSFVGATDMVIVKRTNANASYVIARPF